ncbi:MAG: glutamine--fructose-6-phosphate transaminase (isomerizing) [Candidatus Woesearchaeota archaeon]
MCGIIAYIGKEELIPLLINGLKRLEYRGYDSAGICAVHNKKLFLARKKGKIAELENSSELEKIKGLKPKIGIAHTRWATHGEPSKKNAHPQLDCNAEIGIVHNGIIENFHALKELLEKEGHKIKSDTDTEIVAHLIEKFYSSSLEEAVFKALELVEGTFGLAVLGSREEKIVAARKGSPLVIGIGTKGMFIASDPIAVPTKNVIYLNDNEVAVITKNSYLIKDMNGKKIDKEVCQIKWTSEQLEKKGYKHFMLKEIYEQPVAVENTLRGRIKKNKKDFEIKLSIDIDFEKTKRIIITACGTSWHSALIGKHLIEKIANIKTEVDYASEFRYREPIISEEDAVIAISQSGETADTYAALKEAKKRGAKTAGIVNVVGSTIARDVDSGIFLHAGPEIGVASTKAFTCQTMALMLFALYARQKKGMPLESGLVEEVLGIPEKIELILRNSEKIKALAEELKDGKNCLYLGRGINFPVALEGALKLKEISYIHAEGYPAAEMKHGPIALIDENMPVVFIATKDELYSKIVSNMQEVKARGGRIIAIVNHADEQIKKLAEHIIIVPETRAELSPILNVIPLQLLAYYIADAKGLDVDKPRNLAKSVTVE